MRPAARVSASIVRFLTNAAKNAETRIGAATVSAYIMKFVSNVAEDLGGRVRAPGRDVA